MPKERLKDVEGLSRFGDKRDHSIELHVHGSENTTAVWLAQLGSALGYSEREECVNIQSQTDY